jgi:flagellar hook assembly protein FlgD
VTRLTARPQVVTPNEDGIGESTSVSFALSTRASVAVEVLNSSSKVVRTLASSFSYSAGGASMSWNGRNSSGHLVQDGRYRVRITATSPGQQARRSHGIVVDRTLGHLEIAPTPFSPNGDGRLDSTSIGFRLARQADVRVRIVDGDRSVATVHELGMLAVGAASFSWDGRNRNGAVGDGDYRVLVEATTAFGTRTLSLPVRIDTRAPAVRIVSARHRKDRRTVGAPLVERGGDGPAPLWLAGAHRPSRGPAPGRLLPRHASPCHARPRSGGGCCCERGRPCDSQARGLALVRDLAGLDGA